jgi:hypothetical protein
MPFNLKGHRAGSENLPRGAVPSRDLMLLLFNPTEGVPKAAETIAFGTTSFRQSQPAEDEAPPA